MAQFVNATLSKGEIERILTNAKNNIVIISPYIKINDDLITRLMDAGKRNVRTLLICREEDLKSGERMKLGQIPNLTLQFNERVHAKCFYNEQSMVITSLNLYDSSLGDNREMGILLRSDQEEDKVAFHEAKNEAQFIIRESQESPHTKAKSIIEERGLQNRAEVNPKYGKYPKKEKPAEKSIVEEISDLFGLGDKEKGYCLRCGEPIPLNPSAPYCPECYRTWARYKNETHTEKSCHKCGRPAETSLKYPLCPSCFRKSN